MITRSFIVAAALASSSVAMAGKAVQPVTESGIVFVKSKPNQDLAVSFAVQAIGGRIRASFPQIGWKSVELPKNMTVAKAQKALGRYSAIAKTTPVYRRTWLETPNDPLIGQQYSLTTMRLPETWSVTHGSSDTVVAVIDSGFDVGHPDFAGRLLPGTNFGDGDPSDLTDIVGHGTHVAGIVGAGTNNGIGIAGGVYDGKILPLKVATSDGGVSEDGLVAAITQVGDLQVQVANISIGGAGLNPAEQDAVAYANSRGVLMVIAAGNSNTNTKFYPAAFPGVLSVGATDSSDQRADFSNFGDWVRVAAPGVGILSTYPRSMSETGYELLDGTSMASPNVAGVAGLLFGATGNGVTADEVKNALESTAVNVGDWNVNGRIDAFAALSSLGIGEDFEVIPNTLIAKEGLTFLNATPQAVASDDGVQTTVRGAKVASLGFVSSFEATYDMSAPANTRLAKSTLTIKASGDKNTTLQVFLWNELRGKYEIFHQFPIGTVAKSFSLKLSAPQLDSVMQPDNTIKILFRGVLPTRLKGNGSGMFMVNEAKIKNTALRFGGSA